MSTQLKDKLVTLEVLKMVTDSLRGDENMQLPSINGGKIQIDFDGSKFRYEENELNYKQLHDYHLNTPNFTFVVYGDRAYLLSYDQADTSSMREMRFQSVLAVTDSNGINLVKTSGIYVTSTDGINISSVRITDINSENESYKVDEITSENKNSSVFYPSNKAISDKVGFDDIEIEDGGYIDSSGVSIATKKLVIANNEESKEFDVPSIDWAKSIQSKVNDNLPNDSYDHSTIETVLTGLDYKPSTNLESSYRSTQLTTARATKDYVDAKTTDIPTDAHINSLIDTKLGVIENGTY